MKKKHKCKICGKTYKTKSWLQKHYQREHKNEKRPLSGKKKAMFEALCGSLGNVTAAAETVGIDRSTHYDWLKKDSNYKKWAEEIPERQIDFYEQALNKLVNKGKASAVIFALKTKGKHRGWIERQEISHQGISPISIEITKDGNQEKKDSTD